MGSETTMVAEQYRLQEWATQIRECQDRPAGMSVVDWCACHGITKANYYYRLRRVRMACLENLQEKHPQQSIIPVKTELVQGQPGTGRDQYFNERICHPCGRFHAYAPSGESPPGDTGCLMTLPVLRQSISSAAIQISAPAWTGLRHLSRRRLGTALMCRIPFTFSAADAQTVSRGLCGKGMAGFCYIKGSQRAGSNGRAARRKCSP